MKIFFFLLILLVQQAVWAETILDNSQIASLNSRKLNWPDWSLNGQFKLSQTKKDLTYPEFFNGEWQVLNIDLYQPNSKTINYKARFYYDPLGRLIGDRSYNSQSLGKEVFGDKLLYIKNSTDNPNRQIAIFNNSEYLETKIIGRRQEFDEQGRFFTDELSLQIFHSFSTSRINQVETLSQFQYCQDQGINLETTNSRPICGEQWQATYKGPGETLISQPLRINHFRLILLSSEDPLPSESFLARLSTQKEFEVKGDH